MSHNHLYSGFQTDIPHSFEPLAIDLLTYSADIEVGSSVEGELLCPHMYLDPRSTIRHLPKTSSYLDPNIHAA